MIGFILGVAFYLVYEYGKYKGRKEEKAKMKRLLSDKSDGLMIDIIYNTYEL